MAPTRMIRTANQRQPIGHESLQTGPNRWEYRPLYAEDDGRLDEIHGQIERELRPDGEAPSPQRDGVVGRTTGRATDRASTIGPEELPVPRDDAITRDARPPRPRVDKPATSHAAPHLLTSQTTRPRDARQEVQMAATFDRHRRRPAPTRKLSQELHRKNKRRRPTTPSFADRSCRIPPPARGILNDGLERLARS